MDEERYSIETTHFQGDPNEGRWTGTYISTGDADKVRSLGRVFVNISLQAPSEFDSKIAGDLLLENIQDRFFEKGKSKGTVAKLGKMILTTAKRLEHVLQREKIAAEEGIDLNINMVVLKDGFIYMAVLGEGGIMLQRDGTFINLTPGLKDLSGRGLVRSGSGKYKAGDIFVLLTPNASLLATEADILKAIKDFDSNDFKDKKDKPLFGALILKVEEHKIEKAIPKVAEQEIVEPDEELKEETLAEEQRSGEEPDIGEDDPSASLGQGEEDEEESKLKKFGKNIKDKLADKKTYIVIWEKIKEFAVKLYLLTKEYVWEGFLGLGKKGIYIKGSGPRRSVRGIIILIVLVSAFLFLSIRTIKRQGEKRDKLDSVKVILSTVDENYNNAKSLGEAGDIQNAVEILERSLTDLENAKEHGLLLSEIDEKINTSRDLLYIVQKVVLLTDDNIITDIAGFIENSIADDIVLSQGKLYISDSAAGNIYSVGVDGGEVITAIDSNSGIPSPKALAFDSDGNMMISDSEKGIVKYLMSEGSIETLAGLSSSSVGNVAEMDNYVDPTGSNFLYILRPENNDVRKISRYTSGYSFPELRLSNESFGSAVDIEIDGKIYIMTQSAGILRYYLNNLDPYTIVGLDKPITASSCIELDDLYLYFGDSANKRVVVATKGAGITPNQGNYVAQIVYEGDGEYLKNIKDIVVDADSRIIYILDETKIFKIDLTKVDQYASELD